MTLEEAKVVRRLYWALVDADTTPWHPENCACFVCTALDAARPIVEQAEDEHGYDSDTGEWWPR